MIYEFMFSLLPTELTKAKTPLLLSWLSVKSVLLIVELSDFVFIVLSACTISKLLSDH